MTSLRNRLGILVLLWWQYFDERSVRHSFGYLFIAVTKNYVCKLPKSLEFVRSNVSDIFFSKPWTNTARPWKRKRMMDRTPPDLPSLAGAMRCLITPPPKSASIEP